MFRKSSKLPNLLSWKDTQVGFNVGLLAENIVVSSAFHSIQQLSNLSLSLLQAQDGLCLLLQFAPMEFLGHKLQFHPSLLHLKGTMEHE